jgi:hypothetical protein
MAVSIMIGFDLIQLYNPGWYASSFYDYNYPKPSHHARWQGQLEYVLFHGTINACDNVKSREILPSREGWRTKCDGFSCVTTFNLEVCRRLGGTYCLNNQDQRLNRWGKHIRLSLYWDVLLVAWSGYCKRPEFQTRLYLLIMFLICTIRYVFLSYIRIMSIRARLEG